MKYFIYEHSEEAQACQVFQSQLFKYTAASEALRATETTNIYKIQCLCLESFSDVRNSESYKQPY